MSCRKQFHEKVLSSAVSCPVPASNLSAVAATNLFQHPQTINANNGWANELSEILARPVSPAALRGLLGNLDHTTIFSLNNEYDARGEVSWWVLTARNPLLMDSYYRLKFRQNEILLDEIFLKDELPPTTGTRFFVNLARTAQKLGYKKISLTAHDLQDVYYQNKKIYGYYVWARLGFNAPLPPPARAEFPQYQNLLQLMADPKGRHWWLNNGSKTKMSFNLAAKSLNQKALTNYLTEKQLIIQT